MFKLKYLKYKKKYLNLKNLKNGGMNAPNDLHNAIINGEWMRTIELIQNGADIEAQFNGKTPLIIAIENDRSMIARDLIENGANKEVQFNGKTPLIIAIENNRSMIARDLLNNNANPNAIDLNSGDSPLFIVVKLNLVEIVDLLLDRKADIFFINYDISKNNGKTIFDYIIDNEIKEIIDLPSFKRIQALINVTNQYRIPYDIIRKILGYENFDN